MSKKTVSEVVEIKDHPLEQFLGIEPNTTEVVHLEQKTEELVEQADYDHKDNEIESDLQEIADEAMSGFKNLQETVEEIDPKYAARTLEVANQLLNTALNAIKEKSDLKKHKDKLKVAAGKATGDGKTNTVIIDTNSLIEQLRNANMSAEKNVVAEVAPDPAKE
jgi:triphosphoribosyl-dephospho-CoA synthetase